MKKIVNLLLCLSIFFIGCAGREANPIPVYLPGDEDRSCMGLKAEIAQLQTNMARLRPKTNKLVTNTFWFLFFPFLMDVKDAEKIEFDAMRQRHGRLLVYAIEKNCDMSDIGDIPNTDELTKLKSERRKEANRRRSIGR